MKHNKVKESSLCIYILCMKYLNDGDNLEEERLNEFSTHTLGITFPLEVIS